MRHEGMNCDLNAAGKVALRSGDALVIVDVQNDFLPGGKLGVRRGDEIVPVLKFLH